MKKSKGKFSLKNLKLKEKINIKNTISNIKEKRTKNKKLLRHGSYSIGITALVVAIAVVLNLVIQELPTSIRELDLSSEKLYTIGDHIQFYIFVKIVQNLFCLISNGIKFFTAQI